MKPTWCQASNWKSFGVSIRQNEFCYINVKVCLQLQRSILDQLVVVRCFAYFLRMNPNHPCSYAFIIQPHSWLSSKPKSRPSKEDDWTKMLSNHRVECKQHHHDKNFSQSPSKMPKHSFRVTLKEQAKNKRTDIKYRLFHQPRQTISPIQLNLYYNYWEICVYNRISFQIRSRILRVQISIQDASHIHTIVFYLFSKHPEWIMCLPNGAIDTFWGIFGHPSHGTITLVSPKIGSKTNPTVKKMLGLVRYISR